LEQEEDAFPRPEKQAAARLAAHQAKTEHVRIEALLRLLGGKVEHRLEHAGQLRSGLGHGHLPRAGWILPPNRPGRRCSRARFPSPWNTCNVCALGKRGWMRSGE